MSVGAGPSTSSAAYTPLHPHPRGKLPWLLITHGPTAIASVFLALTLVMSLFPSSSSTSSPPPTPLKDVVPNANGVSPLPPSMRNTLTLPPSSCAQQFPLLYPQLNHLTRFWKGKGGISSSHIDELERAALSQRRWGWARVILKDGRMYIRTLRKQDDTRVTAMLMLLHQALLSDPGAATAMTGAPFAMEDDGPLPPIDMILSVGDKDGFPGADAGPAWVLTKSSLLPHTEGNWLSPDFGFIGWPEARIPSYPEVVDLNRQVETIMGGWQAKDDRAFWRGFPNVYPIRQDLLSRTENASHLPADDSQAWADVRRTSFGRQDPTAFAPLVSLEDHCKRKYLIHSEGNSYSGRSKYLFSCHSVTIAHKLEWDQHFHPALISNPQDPQQNYVEVPGPMFDGLEEAVKGMWEADGDSKAAGVLGWLERARKKKILGRLPPREIADNARDSLRDRYLTPAATACYYRAALRAYASVQNPISWSPTGPHPKAGNGIPPLPTDGKSDPLYVGGSGAMGDISFESWNLIGQGTSGGGGAGKSMEVGDWPPVVG